MTPDEDLPQEDSNGEKVPDLDDLVDRILSGGNDPSPSA